MLEVARFLTRPDAELARSRLEASGIRAFVAADNEGGMAPHMSYVAGVRLLVSATDLDAAKELIATETEGAVDERELEAAATGATGPDVETDDGKRAALSHDGAASVRRALGAAFLGMTILPIVGNLWSLAILVGLRGQPLAPTARRKAGYVAALDALVLVGFALLLASVFGLGLGS